jgi:hypothetical protein
MALQSSGPISWSALNVAYGFSSNATLGISSIRNSTVGVGVSNVSMSNFQNACIPYNSVCTNRYIAGNFTMNNTTDGNTIFGNSNGTITYASSITAPGADYFGCEWIGWMKVPENGNQTFQIYADDAGEFVVNGTVVASRYSSWGTGASNSINLDAGVYSFRGRQVETFGGEGLQVSYTPPSGTYTTPSSATMSNFMSNVVWNYKPIVKLDANDLAYKQGLSLTSQISAWSNNGTDGTLRHASGLSANASTLATLANDSVGYMVSFDRTKQQYFSIGNLEFDQFRSTDATPITNKGLTFFLVGRMSMTNIGSWERFFDIGSGAPNNNFLMSRYTTSASQINIDVYSGTSAIISRYYNNTIDGQFHVYSFTLSNASPCVATLYVDDQAITYGINERVTPSGPANNRTTTINYIGRSNFADAFFTGDIRELLMFRELMDATTLSRMNRYLMYKWGIQAFMPPVTSGMIGLYTGESWTGTQWTDLSGNGNHATTIRGTITTTSVNSLTAIAGGTTAGLRFPSAILPSTYTLLHVVKYNGATRGRIVDGYTTNWFSGFHSSKAGVAYHDAGGWVTAQTDIHGTNWVISADQRNIYRSQGVSRTLANYTNGSSASLSINHGLFTEYSDWACSCVIVYNRELSTNEIIQVETFLMRRYNI